MGGALAFGVLMITGFVMLIVVNGLMTFYPKPIDVLTLESGEKVAGEALRTEAYQRTAATALGASAPHLSQRTLYRTANFDLTNEDFKWIDTNRIGRVERPADIYLLERREWGPFIGFVRALNLADARVDDPGADPSALVRHHRQAQRRHDTIRDLERRQIGRVNHLMEKQRLALRKVALSAGIDSVAWRQAKGDHDGQMAALQSRYDRLQAQAEALKRQDLAVTVELADAAGRTKTLPLSQIVRLYPANGISFWEQLSVYFARWAEFLTAQPREANTEGGVMPAIFGTFVMTVLMALAVAPFGVMAALYLREYARQGRLVSLVRICVNNLAGVPSIVYGVFGLGFFAYMIGGSIDRVFFPERLPNPTFGTGGLLWSALTLALLTVPVVIVSTEEALAAVPQSLREGSLACGASKWQTIKNIVLPKAMPGIMTGLILAMARGAGEVAPLMLVGVVKLAPELPFDGIFPYIHLERSFMHLGFHIYDVGFQSRNAEAGKPMVFMTTLLLISLVGVMNALAIAVRNRLKRKYYVGHF
jgi:phosphate transport system permease protein